MAFVKEQWWHVDKEGRRIGWLWPEDFDAILESFYGRRWVLEFCTDFGFNRSQVDRYRRGAAPIPKHVAQIVQMLGTMKVREIPMSPIEAPWLPEADGANAAGAGEETDQPRQRKRTMGEQPRRGRPRKKVSASA